MSNPIKTMEWVDHGGHWEDHEWTYDEIWKVWDRDDDTELVPALANRCIGYEAEIEKLKADLAAMTLEREALGSQLWELAQRDRDCRALLREARDNIDYDEHNAYLYVWGTWLERVAKLIGK